MKWIHVAVYAIAIFAVGRVVLGWLGGDPVPSAPPVVTVVDSVVVWRERVVAPSGPRLVPVREVRTAEPVEMRLAGCDAPPPVREGGPVVVRPVEPTEPVLAVQLVPGRASVTRLAAGGRAVAADYRVPERGNRLAVQAVAGGPPVVVGDRWWFLRDVELLGLVEGDQRAAVGIKVPVSDSWSVFAVRSVGGVWGLGVAVRPFVRWP